MGYAHRDLKPENLLLDSDFNLLLADFGFAGKHEGVAKNGLMKTNLGTVAYKAPEIDKEDSIGYDGTKADIFSMGIILFIFKAGVPPFQKACNTDILYRFIALEQYEKFWRMHSKVKGANFYSPSFKKLVEGMLNSNPDERFTLEQVTSSDFFTDRTTTIEEVKTDMNKRKMRIDRALKRKDSQFSVETMASENDTVGSSQQEASSKKIVTQSFNRNKNQKKKKNFFGGLLGKLKAKFRSIEEEDECYEGDNSDSISAEYLNQIKLLDESTLKIETREYLEGGFSNFLISEMTPCQLFELLVYACDLSTAKNVKIDEKKFQVKKITFNNLDHCFPSYKI